MRRRFPANLRASLSLFFASSYSVINVRHSPLLHRLAYHHIIPLWRRRSIKGRRTLERRKEKFPGFGLLVLVWFMVPFSSSSFHCAHLPVVYRFSYIFNRQLRDESEAFFIVWGWVPALVCVARTKAMINRLFELLILLVKSKPGIRKIQLFPRGVQIQHDIQSKNLNAASLYDLLQIFPCSPHYVIFSRLLLFVLTTNRSFFVLLSRPQINEYTSNDVNWFL